MYAVTLPSEPVKPIVVDGKAEITFVCKGGVTGLADLYQRDPVRALFPNTPDDEIAQGVIVTTSGGLVGGDRISVSVTAAEGASAMVYAQAAEKVYGSAGEDSAIEVALRAETGSWLEYLPQETILFDSSRLRRATDIQLTGDARVLAGEILVFGRLGHGEHLSQGLVHDAWEITKDDRLIWADALHMDGDISAILNDPACFDGAVAMATVVYAGLDAEQQLATARNIIEGDVFGAATVVNGVLVVRWLSQDAFELRNAFGRFWRKFRRLAAGLPDALPRLWHV